MFENIQKHDLKNILTRLGDAEKKYRDEADKLTEIQRLYYLAVARGVAIARGILKDYFKERYNIKKL